MLNVQKIESIAIALTSEINKIEAGNKEYYRGAREGVQELLNAIKKSEEQQEGKELASSSPKVKAKPAKS